MATCKDCIHSEICLEQYSQLNPDMMFSECKKFKNKADFVEVVHCKDCYYRQVIDENQYIFKGKPAMMCVLHSKLFGENGFCSDGERK